MDSNGLSNYLAWLREEVLDSARFEEELREDFKQPDIAKLHRAVAEAEHFLIKAWERPHSAPKETRKRKEELVKLLDSIITRNTASDALYAHCFPDRVLLEQFSACRLRAQRQRRGEVPVRAGTPSAPDSAPEQQPKTAPEQQPKGGGAGGGDHYDDDFGG